MADNKKLQQHPASSALHIIVSGPDGTIERDLGAGTHIFGGSLASDIVVVGMPKAEVFSLTHRNAGNSFDLKIMTENVLVDAAAVPSGKSFSGLKDAVLQCGDFQFTIRASQVLAAPSAVLSSASKALAPKALASKALAGLTGGKASFSTEDLKQSFQSKGSLGEAARLQSGMLKQSFAGNPQAFVALGVATLLGLLAFVVPRSLPSFSSGDNLAMVETPILNASGLSAELKRRLAGADLAHLVTLQESGDRITLAGTINPAENLRLRDVLATFQGRVKAPLSMLNMVTYGRPEADTLIASVVLEPTKAVISENGDMVAENEVLPSGWRVVRISAERIEIIRDGLSQIVTLPTALAARPAQR